MMDSLEVEISSVFSDVLIFTPYVFEDFRGNYIETYNELAYDQAIHTALGKKVKFIQDDISNSSKHVLRGLHGDANTWKLIQCLSGEFLLAAVDMRKDSKTYLRWETFILNAKNNKQVLLPPMFVNGHLCISDCCIFSYKQSTYYEGAKKQMTVMWDDPTIGVEWPIDTPILSDRDRSAEYLSE